MCNVQWQNVVTEMAWSHGLRYSQVTHQTRPTNSQCKNSLYVVGPVDRGVTVVLFVCLFTAWTL